MAESFRPPQDGPELVRSLRETVTKLREENENLKNEAGLNRWQAEVAGDIDHLTGLKLRKPFVEALERSLKMVRGEDIEHRAVGIIRPEVLSLIFLDADNFKDINETYGHPTGDEVLRKVAKVLKDAVRETDTAARVGGEEFAIILPGANESAAADLAEGMRAKIAELTFNHDGLRVTASFGIASSERENNADALYELADQALNRAKETGKNKVVTSGKEGE